MTKHRLLRIAAAAATTTAFAVSGLPISPAVAASDAARSACRAYNVQGDVASVPQWARDIDLSLRCGNGVSAGAVYIELKHNVPNWDQAEDCLWNIMSLGKITGSSADKVTRTFKWGSSKSAKLIYNPKNKTVISAYPWDGGSSSSWSQCGQQ